MDDEIAPVLLILAAPDELRVEVGIARIPQGAWNGLVLTDDRLVLGGGDVFPLGLVVFEGLDGFGGGGFFLGGHKVFEIGAFKP